MAAAPGKTVLSELLAAGKPEPVPVLHPNLPVLYRRRVEALEEALRDEATALLAAEALRSLIDAILVHPGERRGEVSLSLRGDLAAFMQVAETAPPPAGSEWPRTAKPLPPRGITGVYEKYWDRWMRGRASILIC